MRTFKAVVLEYPRMADSRILWLTASPAADRQQWTLSISSQSEVADVHDEVSQRHVPDVGCTSKPAVEPARALAPG